jgi:hypothetical protein
MRTVVIQKHWKKKQKAVPTCVDYRGKVVDILVSSSVTLIHFVPMFLVNIVLLLLVLVE